MTTVTLGWGLGVIGSHFLMATLTGLVEDTHGLAVLSRHAGVALIVAGFTLLVFLAGFIGNFLAALNSVVAGTTLEP